jgi:Transposase family tnp2
MILAFYLRHNLTWVALEHLLKLVNAVKPGAAPTTKYLFTRMLHTSYTPIFHYYCKKCMRYLGEKKNLIEEFKGSKIICENCNYCFSLKKKNQGTFFVQLPLKQQLQNIIDKHKECFSSTDDDNTFDEINDLTSGSIYKSLKQKYKNLITLTFNTDGVKIYKSKRKSSMWPILMIINELPKSERFKRENMILTGMWYGTDPDFKMYLKPFVDEILN